MIEIDSTNPCVPYRPVINSPVGENSNNNLSSVLKPDNIIKQLPVIFLANIQSFGKSSKKDKTVECEFILDINQVDISVFTETWLNDITKEQLPFKSFRKFHLVRKNTIRDSGGVSIFVNNKFQSSKLKIDVPNHLECLWVRVKPIWLPRKFTTIIVCAIYYPGSTSIYAPPKEDIILHLTSSVLKLRTRYYNPLFLLMGDFNDLPIDEICTTCEFKQLVKDPTRKEAILDLILTNINNDLFEIPKTMPKIGDHYSLLVKPKNYVKPKTENIKIKMRKYPKSAINGFGRWITTFDWSQLVSLTDVNDKTDYFSTMSWSMINKFFPLITVKLTNVDKEWMTPYVKSLISQRQKAHLNKKNELRDCLDKKVKQEIIKAKKNFKKEKVGLFDKQNPKDWYRQVNKIINNGKPKGLNVLNIPELAGRNNAEIANIINNHFAQICKKYPPLDNNICSSENESKEELEMISEAYSYKLIQKFSKKSLGPGDLPQKIFKEFAPELAAPLRDIINCSLRSGVFPEAYKKAEIVPIPKCNPPSLITEFRPISMTSIVGKMIETMYMFELDKDTKGKLDSDQYGNTKGSSTTHYLIKLTDEAYKSTDLGNATTAVTIDYSKAFDYVDHNILIQKLIALDVRGIVIKSIRSFLKNRSHCTNVAGVKSRFENITCGVPQGTVSGPRLFVILINGVKSSVVSNYKFVDDKTIALSYSGDATSILQEVLNIEEKETLCDKMIINGSKCHSITFNFSKKNTPPSNLTLQGNNILPCDVIKLLGVVLSKDLKWTENTNSICSKVNQRFFYLCKLKQFGFQKDELVTAWCTMIRPLIEYAAPLWHSGLTEAESKKLEALQKKAMGIIFGIVYKDNKRLYKLGQSTVNYKKLLEIIGLPSLYDRREALTNKFALQTFNNKAHKSMFQEKKSNSVNLRRNAKFTEVKWETTRYRHSAIPYMSRILNGVFASHKH